MRALHPPLLAIGLSLGPVLGTSSCSFPEYAFSRPDPSAGSGGSGNAVGVAGDSGNGMPGGTGGHSTDAGSSGVAGSGAGAGGSLAGAGAAGNGGNAGSAGGGGAPHVPNQCADLDNKPNYCTCADDATHAYLFCSQTRTFAAAASQCTFYEMHLVKQDSAGENSFVSARANQITQPAGVQYFWIGASSLNSPGVWHWTDQTVFWQGGASGTPTSGAYFNWRTDQPQSTVNAACAYMDLDGSWQDGDCTQNRPYVCEAD